MDQDSDDQREVELSSLEAIFPELQRLAADGDSLTFQIDLPVNPPKPVTVTFPAAPDAPQTQLPADAAAVQNGHPAGRVAPIDSHQLAYLPSISARISLPKGYPTDEAPAVKITANPSWLPRETIAKLEADGPRLWEELGRDMVAFTYIDHIQQAAEDVFGLVDGEGLLAVDPMHKIAVLDHDIKARRAAFEKETFSCGVCLDPKKGTVCHKMMDCGHIFCIQCLQDFYGNAIKEGDLASVRCLTPKCAKERSAASSSKKQRKPKTFISPSELLQIGLPEDMVKRYVTLKYKTELEADKNTIYCPRTWCTGAARSKYHKPPEGLQLGEASDNDSDDEEGKSVLGQKFDRGELLCICENCGFAFCSRCLQSWHGEFFSCVDARDRELRVTEEEKASLEYLKSHTTPCPTCAAPVQKTYGCNHMVCFRCESHFCYLCSAWLDSSNPYQHFNKQPDGKVTSCYMRLWELEAGGDARVERGERNDLPQVINIVPEIEEPDDEDESDDDRDDGDVGNGGQVGVAREGPLVLRIAADPAANRGGRRPVPPAVPAAPAPQGARGGRGRRGGPRRGRANRGPAGRGGLGPAPQQQQGRAIIVDPNADDGGLNPQDAAWVRWFVRMALNDEEDDEDEDEEGEDVEIIIA